MKIFIRCTLLLLVAALACPAQTLRGAVEREFPFSLPAVKAALDNIGAYTGNRLPSLEGFAEVGRINLKDYQRPYYEYKIELDPKGDNKVVVRVRANVSAWYTGPDQPEAGYRGLESNGRLENDLLDRLSDYLRDKSADAATLTQWIATAKQQKEETDRPHRGPSGATEEAGKPSYHRSELCVRYPAACHHRERTRGKGGGPAASPGRRRISGTGSKRHVGQASIGERGCRMGAGRAGANHRGSRSVRVSCQE